MTQEHFTLVKAKALTESRLALTFADGEEFTVHLEPTIKRYKSLTPLADPKVFAKVKVTDHGHTVTWAGNDDLQLASDNLRARSIEQAGGVSHEFIWNWMYKHELTLEAASEALGLSRRMLAYYRSGEKPVPLTVGLACLGWEKAQMILKGAATDSVFALAA